MRDSEGNLREVVRTGRVWRGVVEGGRGQDDDGFEGEGASEAGRRSSLQGPSSYEAGQMYESGRFSVSEMSLPYYLNPSYPEDGKSTPKVEASGTPNYMRPSYTREIQESGSGPDTWRPYYMKSSYTPESGENETSAQGASPNASSIQGSTSSRKRSSRPRPRKLEIRSPDAKANVHQPPKSSSSSPKGTRSPHCATPYPTDTQFASTSPDFKPGVRLPPARRKVRLPGTSLSSIPEPSTPYYAAPYDTPQSSTAQSSPETVIKFPLHSEPPPVQSSAFSPDSSSEEPPSPAPTSSSPFDEIPRYYYYNAPYYPGYLATEGHHPQPQNTFHKKIQRLLLHVMLLRCALLSLLILDTSTSKNEVPQENLVKIRDLVREQALGIAKEVESENGNMNDRSKVGTCYYWLGRAEMGLGELEAARESFKMVLGLGGEDDVDEGRREEVERWMAECEGKGKGSVVDWI